MTSQLAVAIDAFMALPGLRAFWPLSNFSNTGEPTNLTYNAFSFTLVGNPLYNVTPGGAGYIEFDGTSDALSFADDNDFDITGTEAHIAGAQQGLTIGGWFYLDSFTDAFLLDKFGAGAGVRSYSLEVQSSGIPRFRVSTDGTAIKNITSSVTLSTGRWYFIVGRYDPSTEVAVFVGTTKDTSGSSVPASIFNSSSEFRIGNQFGATMDGRASWCFLCAELVSDAQLSDIYSASLPLFNPVEPNITDSVAVGETVSRALVSLVNKTDGITVGESVSRNLVSLINPTDALTIGESRATDIISLINKTDSVTVGETVSLTVSTPLVNVSDGLAVGDSVTARLVSLANVSDGLTVGEGGQTVVLVSLPSVSDGLTIGEAVTATLAGNISPTDTVAVGETTAVSLGDLQVSASDGVTLGETVTLILSVTGVISISTVDGVVIGESATLTIFTISTIVVVDSLGFVETELWPIFAPTDTLTLTDEMSRGVSDTLTFTDTTLVDVGILVITDTLTLTELQTVTGGPVTPPAPPATGGIDTGSRIVLKLHYGNDKRNPLRTLDIAQMEPGGIQLKAASGTARLQGGELTELWSGESIRFDGQQKLAESRKNSQLAITYVLRSNGSAAALSYFQRQINRFWLEAKQHQVRGENHAVWLEYRWSDGINGLATPTFGQLSGYYEIYAAKAPRWPDTLHDQMDDLSQGLVDGVLMELTASPAPEGLKQLHGTAAGPVSLVENGVLIASGSSSKLHYTTYTNSGLTGNFTVTGWITLNATWTSGTKYIFDYYYSASERVSIAYDRGNTRWVITKIVGGTTYTANSASDSVANGDNVHLCLVQDDTTLHLYVNGVSVASVAAANTLTDAGTIALGCPATGTVDGVDVILDGWRIMPDDASADEAAAIYTAELPIKTDGGRVGEPPFWLTPSGDGEVDNALDSTHQNYGIIGGVGGDLEAKTQIIVTGSDFDRYYWLGVKAVDPAAGYDPLDYIWREFATGTVFVSGAASEGSHRYSTGADQIISVALSGIDTEYLFNRYRWLTRLATSASTTLTPAWSWRPGDTGLNKSPTITFANSAFEIVDAGDIFVRTEAQANIVSLSLRFYTTGTTTFSRDFVFLVPYPYVKLSPVGAGSITNQIYIEDGLAYSWSTNVMLEFLEYNGAALRVMPNKLNYLFLLQVKTADDDFDITDTASIQVWSTPRYLLPGGMVA